MQDQEPRTKVFVVDDDAVLLRVLRRTLKTHHDVITVQDPTQARAVFEDNRDVAVILSDYTMPKMSGVELLREALEVVPAATRILTSGAAELGAFRDVIDECQLYTFVAKPFETHAVRIVVQRAAEHHLLAVRNQLLVDELAEQAASEQALRRAFQQYVPAEVVNDLIEVGGTASLAGLERNVTVLLADLRGFTGFSEKRPPSEVVAVLNRFFSAMAAPLLAHGGTIDKYIGDSILAHFGGLRPDPAAPDNALQAALDMRVALGKLNDELTAQGTPALHFGVGINTGSCIIGNVGCAARMDYTVIGDAVNLAARVQELTKSKPDAILLTGATREGLTLEAKLTRWSPVSVRGRQDPVAIFEVLD